jgi:hypothetical protein
MNKNFIKNSLYMAEFFLFERVPGRVLDVS